MIREVKGDILLSQADAIAHGVAINDDFKQGLALSLRERWPSLYKDFRHFCHTQGPKEGDIWTWKGPGSSMFVQLLTQQSPRNPGDHPGRATLAAVNHSLRSLAQEATKKNFRSIALTKVATGVGGLPWNEVKPLIEQQLGGLGIPVFVYATYIKDQKASE